MEKNGGVLCKEPKNLKNTCCTKTKDRDTFYQIKKKNNLEADMIHFGKKPNQITDIRTFTVIYISWLNACYTQVYLNKKGYKNLNILIVELDVLL